MLGRNRPFVAKGRWKLAGHAVTGNPTEALRPERAVETMNLSVVLSGQNCTTLPDQPPCGWLISSGRFATSESFLLSTNIEICWLAGFPSSSAMVLSQNTYAEKLTVMF